MSAIPDRHRYQASKDRSIQKNRCKLTAKRASPREKYAADRAAAVDRRSAPGREVTDVSTGDDVARHRAEQRLRRVPMWQSTAVGDNTDEFRPGFCCELSVVSVRTGIGGSAHSCPFDGRGVGVLDGSAYVLERLRARKSITTGHQCTPATQPRTSATLNVIRP